MERPSEKNADVEQTILLKDGKEVKDLTFAQKIKIMKDNITVEPVFSFYLIANLISVVGFQNLNLDKACRVNLGYNDSVCTALTLRQRENLNEEEEAVQKLVASVEAWRSIISTACPLIVLAFLGAWSDRMGKRKICLLMPIGAELLSSIVNIINTYFFYSLSVEWTSILSTVFLAIGGSYYVMYLGTFSYVSDITSDQSRTFRMGLLTMALSVSFPVGMGVSGIILRYTGYYGVFGIATVLQVLNFLYVFFYIKENTQLESIKKVPRKNCSKCIGFLAEFFSLQSIKDLLQLLFKRRPNNQRMKLCLVMMIVCLLNGPIWGELTITYILCRYRFNWDEIKYGIFTSYNFIVHSIGTLFAITLFTKKMKIDDSALGIIATASRLLGAFVWAFARNNTEVYLASLAEIFDGTIVICTRAMASKYVTSQELGKVFSLFGLVEVLMMLLLSPLYSRVYMATLTVMPGAVYFITIAFAVPAVFIFIWFLREHRRDKRINAPNTDCAEEPMK